MNQPDDRRVSARRVLDRIALARQRRFVGRDRELSMFRQAVEADDPPFTVLHVYGPGGIGKSSLLREFANIAREHGRHVAEIDGRNIEPTPVGFERELVAAFVADTPEFAMNDIAENTVIIIDTFEFMESLASWLRRIFIPELPANALIVIAGRNVPGLEWRIEPGWDELVRLLPLRNLQPRESQSFLELRGVPDSLHPEALRLTYGHPLALSLVADLVRDGSNIDSLNLADHPDIVGALVDHLVRDVPGPDHRTAIEVSAHVRVTTMPLLTELFGQEQASTLFDWLRGLSFMEQGSEGLFPHDLARDAIEIESRWRNSERYRELHRRARACIVRHLQASSGMEQQRAFFDLLYLHRYNSIMQPFFDWDALGASYAETANPADHESMIELAQRHIGDHAAAIARHWLIHQPEGFRACRDSSGNLIGFTAHLWIHDAGSNDIAIDPAIGAAIQFVESHGPLRRGETMLYHRFDLSLDGLMKSGPVVSLSVMNSTVLELTSPRLAWSFVTTDDPDHWHELLTYVNLRRIPDADYEVDGRHFAVYAHDWRVDPVEVWLETMSEREIATNLTIEDLEAAQPEPLIVLSRPAFDDAVRQALRNFTRPDLLATSPLLRSRLVREAAGNGELVEALRTLLRQAADDLRGNPRDEKLYRAIWRTWLEPAASQELAAESLGIPFSTYRYHLNGGVERIADWLWEREINPQR